jgi:hypothetical protein
MRVVDARRVKNRLTNQLAGIYTRLILWPPEKGVAIDGIFLEKIRKRSIFAVFYCMCFDFRATRK